MSLNGFAEKHSCNKCNKSWHDYKEFDVKHKYDKCLAEFKIWTAPTKTNEEGKVDIRIDLFTAY